MKTLESLRQLAYRSHSGTSFSPERRAESVVNDYSEELDQDIETIKSKGASQEQVDRYKTGYISKLSSYLSSHSNVVSTMIAGPANFPAAMMNKRSQWADNHYHAFREWRTKVLKAYDRYEKNRKIEAAGGPLEIAKNKLAELERLQEYMKKINKAHAAFTKNEKSILNNTELTEAEKKIIINYVPQYSWIKHPYAPYQLTNNNANISSTKKRIAELEVKEQNAQGQNKVIPFEGGVCELNYELDRVTIKHDQRPDQSVISNLKSNGFKWSPHYSVWMRKITPNAFYSASRVLGIEIK